MTVAELVTALGVGSAFSATKAKATRLGIRMRVELRGCLRNEDDVRRTIRAFVDAEDMPDCPLSAQERMILLKEAHAAAGVTEA